MTEANKHAVLGPSTCHRWAYCPASVLLTRGMPDEPSSYANEGSKAHRLAELTLCVKWAMAKAEEAAEEMAAIKAELPEAEQHVAKYVELVDAIEKDEVLFHGVEMKLGLTRITGEPDAYGTADCVIITKASEELYELHIIDFKYGMGVPVSPVQNAQLGMYALAALNEFDPGGAIVGISTVYLHIVQPRIDNVKFWAVSREGLEEKFRLNIKQAADRARYLLGHPDEVKTDFPFQSIVEKRVTYDETKRTGDVQKVVIEPRGDFSSPANAETVCKWCKAKAKCPVLRQQLADTLAGEFDDLPPVPIAPEVKAELKEIPVPDTPEHLAAAYRYVSMIRQWADAVEEGMRKNLSLGTSVPGWKLVAGRQGPRKWANEDEAEEILRRALRVDTVYDRKVISPTTAEKLMKEGLLGPRYWAKLNALISRSEGKPAIVPADDPREAIVPQIETDFD